MPSILYSNLPQLILAIAILLVIGTISFQIIANKKNSTKKMPSMRTQQIILKRIKTLEKKQQRVKQKSTKHKNQKIVQAHTHRVEDIESNIQECKHILNLISNNKY